MKRRHRHGPRPRKRQAFLGFRTFKGGNEAFVIRDDAAGESSVARAIRKLMSRPISQSSASDGDCP
jgi:hypothetical protein